MNQRKLYLAGGLLCAALMVGFVILFFAGGKSGDPETLLVPQSSSSSQEAPSSGDGAGSGAASSSRPDSSSQEEASREESSREESSSSQAEEDSQSSSSQETAPVDGEVSLNQVQDVYVIGGEDGLCYRVTDNNDKREFLQRLGQASPTQETPQREDPQPATVQIRMKDGALSQYLVSEEQISLGGRLCRSTQEERERLMDLVYLCQEDYPPRPQWMASYYGMTLTQISFDGQSHDQLWAVQTTVTDPQDLEEIADLLEDLDVDGRRGGQITDDYIREAGPGQYDRYDLSFAGGTRYTLFVDDFTMVVHREGDSYGWEYRIDDSQIFHLREIVKGVAERTPGSVVQTVVGG